MASAARGVFIVAAKRTPFGAFGGKLADKTCVDLQEVAAKAALAAGNVDPSIVDSAVIGNVISAASPDGAYVSRHVLLRCGIPIDRPALTVNRLCGSGFQSVVNAAQEILVGDSNVVLTGGTDNMSQAPFMARNIRFGTRLGADYKLEDSLWTSLTDFHCKTPMGVTAENLAEKYGITRDEAEAFGLASQQNWAAANQEGRFKAEISPVMLKIKGKEVQFDTDEHPRPQTTKESLAKLPSVFKKTGTVTAGTASGISDGAGAVIVASEDAIKQHGLKHLLAGAQAGGKSINDIDLIEINEAFAPQTLACMKELNLDPSKVNVNGGAIALGHPLAASGARITAHLVTK
ncbi:3-ketoacyl-CoA thiolase, mitochondrial [Orchesella cincta]|uniref:3-ketoacyl-CoA thiolase, mitochondrial n=1 Tax=Orchesella cincta TaxID=48709 RepID=A0A1D2M632_ORCCI|nr:3-ketoacyl-CoA thiolase, mitochondrial [Orchesella cincta]